MAGSPPVKPKPPRKGPKPPKLPKQPFRFRRKHVTLLVLFALIFAAILTFIPPLRIKQVSISGNYFVTLPTLQKQIRPSMGDSLLWTWAGFGLKGKLLSANPQLEKVSFCIRGFGKLHIKLKEKQPALLFVGGSKTLLVALDGSILRRDSDQVAIPYVEDLYIVHGVSETLFTQKSVDPEVVQKLVYIMFQVKTYLPGMQFQLDLNQTDGPIEITELHSLELLKDDTLPIIIGAFERLDQKFKFLRLYFDMVVPTLLETPIEYIDLRIPGKVIVKYGA